MREAGLLTGSDHYLYPEPAPEGQALAFYQALTAGRGFSDELPPVVDVEQAGLWEARVRGFLEAFAELWERTVMIYASRFKWHELVGRDRGWALAHPLWVADWGKVAAPRLPTPWNGWGFWQTMSKGQVPGYAGNVDLDLFNGTEAELRERYRRNGGANPGSWDASISAAGHRHSSTALNTRQVRRHGLLPKTGAANTCG